MNDYYKPLAPAFRREINESIKGQIQELEPCKRNALINAQIAGLKAFSGLINALPDGYPIPMKRGQE